jgi:hypothetical protein
MKNLALSLLIAGSLVMPVAFAADSDMKADSAQTSEMKNDKTHEAMEPGDGHAKKHHARKHHGKKHHGKHHKRHHRHHMTSARCGSGGCGSSQRCN